ncbi:Alpha/Beta hydrolase protein [Abortiporus biennis]|nr:Alpha/Beta hydrolase protein [Abortiporus biennis]
MPSKLKSTATQALHSPLLTLLTHFETPSDVLPPSARVGDPKLKQRDGPTTRLWQIWKYGAFVAVKATELVSATVSHHLRGPAKKSWGIEMTLLSSIMRDAGRHSHLADVATIRLLMSIGGLAPLPSDALVTPVTFRVRKRNLRGLLADFDSAEDGTRELSGEWVVGKGTWQRLQREWRSCKETKAPLDGGSQSRHRSAKRKERVILYLHGGAYYMFSPATHRLITIPLSKALNARLFAVDYRLAPETRFPGPLHDAVSTYFRMIDDLHIQPENIIVAGDSAGGGIALALMMYLRDNNYPLPGSAILMSPWVDLTMSCDSWESNSSFDIVPMPQPGDHLNPIACYLGEHMEKYLTHPYASPLFGDLRGLPPLLIQAGDAEVLRDEITLLAHKATLHGVQVRHELYEDAVHVFQSMPFMDASKQAFISAGEFVREVLSSSENHAQPVLEKQAEEQLQSEINSDSARVVQGDGTESSSLREDLSLSMSSPEKTDSEGISTPEEEPSWISSSPWPSLRTPVLDSGKKQVEKSTTSSLPSPQAVRYPTTSEKRSNASPRRHSTASSYLHSSHASSNITSRRGVPSQQSLSNVNISMTLKESPKLSVPSRPASSRGYRVSNAISMSPSTAPAPRPYIRRSTSSHPDITVLCQQWANSGPANQTVTFKPEVIVKGSPSFTYDGVRRKTSSTFSSASTAGDSPKRYYI